jgi:preprotein translocase subunit SecA
MTFFNFPEDQPLTHSMVSKAIEQAQVKVEGFNFDIRKHLVDFDDVLNKQREIIYSLRRKMLILPETDEKGFKETILDIFTEEIASLINNYAALGQSVSSEDLERLSKDINMLLPIEKKEIISKFNSLNTDPLITHLEKKITDYYRVKEKKAGHDIWMEVCRMMFLSTIDTYWTEHLTAIEDLREGINLRGYAQIDPLVAYKNEAFGLFERLIGNVNFEATRRILKVEVDVAPTQQQQKEQPKVFLSASGINPFTQQKQEAPSGESQQQTVPVSQAASRKLGRNEPCWCGSGKKYKKCHYPK